MSVWKSISIVCFGLFIIAPAFAQSPPTGSAQGASGSAPAQGSGGSSAMPQTKTYTVDDFVSAIDTDKDGFMTVEEFKAVGLTDRMWTFCDPDGDKKISKAEMGACKLPEAVDMSKDGKLAVEEVVAFEKTSLGKERGPGEAKPE